MYKTSSHPSLTTDHGNPSPRLVGRQKPIGVRVLVFVNSTCDATQFTSLQPFVNLETSPLDLGTSTGAPLQADMEFEVGSWIDIQSQYIAACGSNVPVTSMEQSIYYNAAEAEPIENGVINRFTPHYGDSFLGTFQAETNPATQPDPNVIGYDRKVQVGYLNVNQAGFRKSLVDALRAYTYKLHAKIFSRKFGMEMT